jgi:nucleotide-binding universal stress UspA family protein
MYKHILVPLDASAFAESVLPYVVDLARRAHARVTVFSAVTQTYFVYAVENMAMLDALRERDLHAARHYLAGIAARLNAQGVSDVGTLVEVGSAAECICAAADGLGCDLIAMTTHGRGGIQRLLLGSVADRVLHHAHQPVFLAHGEVAVSLPEQKRAALAT